MNCEYCKADCVHRGEQREKECKGHIHMTNADRIRAMSDEELAEHLYAYATLEQQIQFCQNLPECDKILDTGDEIPDEKCMGCLIEWLRQPAEMPKVDAGSDGTCVLPQAAVERFEKKFLEVK